MAAAIFPAGIYSVLKTVLENCAELSYVDKIVIQKYRYPGLPEFTRHAIVISPMAAISIPYPAHQRLIENQIMLALLIKVADYSQEEAILADDMEEDPVPENPKVGILPMYEDVYTCLYANDLGGVIELTPGLSMLDDRSDFNVLMDDDREGFYMEAKMYYSPRGHRFISLP